MSDNLNMPPNPLMYNQWKSWAADLHQHMIRVKQGVGTANPNPLMLPFKQSEAKAVQKGTVLYDPGLLAPIVATGTEWLPLLVGTADLASVAPSYTATEIADVTSDANTVNKQAGKIVYDSTNSTLAVANGSSATSTWSRLTVSATVTPA